MPRTLPNPATFQQRVAALELAVNQAIVSAPTAAVLAGGGATGYTYVVVAKYFALNVPSVPAATTTGAANLTPGAPNVIQWSNAPILNGGLLVPLYDVYRTVGGATQGKIASNVVAEDAQGNQVALQVIDSGLVADGSVPPGLQTGTGASLVQSVVAAGPIAIGSGTVLLAGAALVAATLALPTVAQNGSRLLIVNDSAFANTVTTPANGIGGADHIITFTAAIGGYQELVAVNGVWYPLSEKNATLS